MKNWNPIIYSLLGGIIYIANSAIFPTWSHTLVGIFSALIFIAAYWLLGDKLKTWIRVSITAAVAVIAAAIVRLICV